jgi:hypothetical protein
MARKRGTRKKRAGFQWSHITKGIILLIIASLTGASLYIIKNPSTIISKEKPVYYFPAKPTGKPSSSHPAKLESVTVQLFFSDVESDLLVKEKRTIVWKAGDVHNQIRAILAALWDGSLRNLLSPIPSQVVVRGVSVRGSVATISFSSDLVRNHPGGTLAEMHTLYAIVNSLLINIPCLKKIRILVEGKALETLKGHIDCRTPFTINLSIVKKS